MTDGLLLIHAFPLDASMWEPQITGLGGKTAIVAPNLPGFGGTALYDQTLTMDAAADAVADALTREGIDRAVVCGLSLGGYVAFAFWRRHRDRVAGMVLANTRAVADDEEGKQRRLALAQRLRTEGNVLVDSPPPLLSESASEELWGRVKDIIARQPAEAIAAVSAGMAERPDSTRDLAGIDVPTLVITSTGDTLIPADATKAMGEQISGARTEVIDGAGHLSNLEAPAEFNRLLQEHVGAAL
ncbi:MAG TPA: alpha/beta fold hydrolase [Actinomycetota bacterium]|nr:alpha/beta fold hydrolase [Actinomycetota bacterium]